MPMSVITVAGINPILNILGATQQFNYTQELSVFQMNNTFIPGIGLPSTFNMEYRNNLLSGFRWTHLTSTTDTHAHGSLTLQSFVNAQSSGINLLTFTESGNIEISSPIITPKGGLYMSGNPTGTSVLAGTFTKILGTTTQSFANNFIHTNNRLQYIGTNTITNTVSANISASHGVALGTTLGVSIYKNGVTPIPAANYDFQLTPNSLTSLSISGVPIEFATNDYVEVFVSSVDATTVLVTDMNLLASI